MGFNGIGALSINNLQYTTKPKGCGKIGSIDVWTTWWWIWFVLILLPSNTFAEWNAQQIMRNGVSGGFVFGADSKRRIVSKQCCDFFSQHLPRSDVVFTKRAARNGRAIGWTLALHAHVNFSRILIRRPEWPCSRHKPSPYSSRDPYDSRMNRKNPTPHYNIGRWEERTVPCWLSFVQPEKKEESRITNFFHTGKRTDWLSRELFSRCAFNDSPCVSSGVTRMNITSDSKEGPTRSSDRQHPLLADLSPLNKRQPLIQETQTIWHYFLCKA
jgi:hypothetical protein